jgi:multiple sugar transport system permease protein
MLKRRPASSNPFKVSLPWMGFSYIVLIFWAFVILFPLYWLVVTAFKLPIDVNTGPKYLPFVDYQPVTNAWQELIFDTGNFVLRPYFNTLNVGLFSSIFALIIGACASYALTRFEYRPKPGLILTFAGCVVLGVFGVVVLGQSWQLMLAVAISVYILLSQTIGKRFKGTMSNNDVAFWLVSQRMLPPVAVIIPIYIMFQQLSLLNTLPALIIAYTAINLPLVIWFLRDYFSSIPLELEESAFIDGASRYRVLWSIVLPLSMPGLVATFLIVLVFAWNEYVLALFLSGADTQTMPMLVAAQNATRGRSGGISRCWSC